MKTRPRFALSAFLVMLGACTALSAPASPPAGVSVKLISSREGNFGDSPIIIVPTIFLKLPASGHVFVAKQGSALSAVGGGSTNSVKASANYTVRGLDKKFVQELAAKVYDDFVARLRAAGYTVKTYADIKDLGPVKGAQHMDTDAGNGLPTEKDRNGNTVFIVATPSDAQAFRSGLSGGVFNQFMSGGKSTLGEGTVLMPTYEITAPQIWGEKGGGYSTISAGINAAPGMNLAAAIVPLLTSKGAWGSAQTKEQVTNISPKVGELSKSDTSPKAANALSSTLSSLTGTGKIKGSSSNFTFTIDPAAYAEGVATGTSAFNAEALKVIAKARK